VLSHHVQVGGLNSNEAKTWNKLTTVNGDMFDRITTLNTVVGTTNFPSWWADIFRVTALNQTSIDGLLTSLNNAEQASFAANGTYLVDTANKGKSMRLDSGTAAAPSDNVVTTIIPALTAAGWTIATK
jgi:hypothetical protein